MYLKAKNSLHATQIYSFKYIFIVFIHIYIFLLEKQTFNGFLKVIGIQIDVNSQKDLIGEKY